MHEKKKYRHIPWNRYNLEKYRDIHFWSYRPALAATLKKVHYKQISNDFNKCLWSVEQPQFYTVAVKKWAILLY